MRTVQNTLSLFVSQLPKVELILFNNGLHGWHLDDSTDYAKFYDEMVVCLIDNYPDIPLILVLTTYIKNETRLERVKVRNNEVLKIAEKYQLPVIDLFKVTEKNKEHLSEDGIHFTQEGYNIIAKEIVSAISKYYVK